MAAWLHGCMAARKVSTTPTSQQPPPNSFQVAEVFTGTPGKYVSLENTISGFKVGGVDHRVTGGSCMVAA
jgi:F0F1-type ATP synthase beta subunit